MRCCCRVRLQGIFIPGLAQVPVTSRDDVMALLKKTSKNRSSGVTNMNEHSSRSHLVVQLYVTGTNSLANFKCRGKLNLIDLAGSERVGKTEATGDRLVEVRVAVWLLIEKMLLIILFFRFP